MKMTVTEGLQEIKTLKARVAKRRVTALPYVARPENMVDPFAKEGLTSEQFIQQERQGIADLEKRIVRIRTAIQRVNLDSKLEVDGVQGTVADWLVWRREVAQGAAQFLAQIAQRVGAAREQGTFGQRSKAEMVNIVATVSEKDLAADIEQMEKTLGQLDGRLSLHNATAVIEVD